MTRDSIVWGLGIVGAALTYLLASDSPAQWGYHEWLQAAAFVVATLSGKLATSPLPGESD